MFGIITDEVLKQPLDFGRHDLASFRLDAALDHGARAAADQIACGFIGHRWQAFAGEYDIERIDEVGCGIDECAIEVEDDYRAGHSGDR